MIRWQHTVPRLGARLGLSAGLAAVVVAGVVPCAVVALAAMGRGANAAVPFWLVASVGAAVACAVLAVVMVPLLVRRAVDAPVAAILCDVRSWSRGNTSTRMSPAAVPDAPFGPLAAALNDLAAALDARQRQLEQMNVSLEARVAERTHTLSETNNRLLVEINERERTDAALRRSQKLQAVGQLAGGIAHEFNNLLTTIMGALELARLREGGEAVSGRSSGAALAAAQRGARLTSQLLAFARRQRLMPTATDLNAVIADMRELLEGTIGRGISLRLDLAPQLWPALADPHEIDAAILNLALNAREAMGQGGSLTLVTRNTVLPRPGSHAEPAGEFVELVVEDDGAGMTEDELAHAVDPFFTTKAPGQGAGLGLSQVHGVVQQLGGDLHIASAKGFGTTVSVFLPRARAAVAPRPRNCATEGGGRAILLVDDDDQVRQVASEMLHELGYQVTQAAGGMAALEVLRGQPKDRPFAALVADYAMPGMTGLELIAQARQEQPQIVALVITGYMDLQGLAGAVALEPNQILRKPFTLSQLAARLAELTTARTVERV